jgi:hypothetical protein
MQHTNSTDTRVAIFRLGLAVAIFALPSMAMTDRTAEARADSVVSAAEAPLAPLAAATVVGESASAFDAATWSDVARSGIDPELFSLALEAAATAAERGRAADPATLTVIDFSKPSTDRRMWVYDLRGRSLLFHELVSHGRGSGRTLPTMFSNEPESYKSSLGLFRTAEAYIGKHGYSLRLDGLEPGINDRARQRAIVVHGASYVNGAAAQAQGFLGRSLGCPAVRPEVSRNLIDAVKNGGLVFAYYPDPDWLTTSAYLN